MVWREALPFLTLFIVTQKLRNFHKQEVLFFHYYDISLHNTIRKNRTRFA